MHGLACMKNFTVLKPCTQKKKNNNKWRSGEVTWIFFEFICDDDDDEYRVK